jgi:hypothetical protein
MDFPLGWPVIPAANVRRTRPLSRGATALVGTGEQVRPDQPVAERPGPEGQREYVLAGLAGRVAQVTPGHGLAIEGAATIIQGLLGVGGPVTGPLHFLPRSEAVAVAPIPRGAVVVFPGQAPLTLLQRAASMGAAGVIAGSVGARELEAFTRADMSSVLDGLVPEIASLPLTLIFTQGAGAAPMDAVIHQALTQRTGDIALVTGFTDPRRNVRPEVLLALPLGSATMAVPADGTVALGARVRVTAGRTRGARGEVVYQFSQRQRVEPGILARAVRVQLEDGTSPVLPVSFVERIG